MRPREVKRICLVCFQPFAAPVRTGKVSRRCPEHRHWSVGQINRYRREMAPEVGVLYSAPRYCAGCGHPFTARDPRAVFCDLDTSIVSRCTTATSKG